MFLPYGAGPQGGSLATAFFFMTGFGHSSVIVFFVMSGFLVGGKVLERLALGTFSWLKYLIDRSSRLYAVYFLALILGAMLDYNGYHHLNRFGLYDRSFSGTIAVVNQDFHAASTPLIYAVNLLMCQTVLGPVFGSNGPLWSLANEFWYYVAGPLLFSVFYRLGAQRMVLNVSLLGTLFWFLPAEIVVYFLLWLLGAALYFCNTRALLPVWLSSLLLCGSLIAARGHAITVPYSGDFLIGISFALLINSAAGSSVRLPGQVLSRRAADFSYSVYLCHFPLLVFLLSALFEATGKGLQQKLAVHSLALYLTVLCLVYVWCYLVSLTTERQTPRIRQLLHRVLQRDTPA